MNKHNLTNENYFSIENNMKYMGTSQFKAFKACPAAAMASIKGLYRQEKTPALLVGSYVDAHFEGTLDIFKAQNPEIFTTKGELKSQYNQANYIIERIERDDFFMKQMSGQKQVIMVGEIEGVWFKVKIDSYLPNKRINDLKIMKDFEPIWVPEQGKVSFIEAWGYDLQGAIYQEVIRQNTGERLPFSIIAATKQKEPDIDAFELPQHMLDSAMEEVKGRIESFDGIKKGIFEADGCGRCDWCKSQKVLTEFISAEELIYE